MRLRFGGAYFWEGLFAFFGGGGGGGGAYYWNFTVADVVPSTVKNR